MKKETENFAVNPFDPTKKITLDQFLNFLVFDKNNEVIIDSNDKENLRDAKVVKIQKKQKGFVFYENNEFLIHLSKDLKIEKRNYHIYKSIL